MPVIPQSLASIIRMSENGDISARAIEKTLERDLSVSTKLLKVANSPYYGGGNVNTISRAIQMLGSSGITSVVTSLAMQALISGVSASKRFDRIEYWKHSLATAVCCRIVGRMQMPLQAEELYAAGLMHDVGLIMMDRFIPAELDYCLEESAASGLPLHCVEQDRLGYTHAEVGALLAEKWAFSPLTVNGIRFHQQPEMDAQYQKTSSVVHIADCFAHEAGFDNNQPAGLHSPDPFFLKKLDIAPETAKVIEEVTAVEVKKAVEAFHAAA